MTSLRSRILKANTVTVDAENKVVIQVPTSEDIEILVPDETESIEETARGNAARIVAQAESDAQKIHSDALASAQAEQSKILATANAEAERIATQAREQAYKEGLAKAVAEGDEIRARAERELVFAKDERLKMQQNLEPEILSLITDILDKLLGDSVKINPNIITHLIKQGLYSSSINGEIKILVSQHDYEEVVKHKEAFMKLTDGSVRLEIVKDLSLDKTDCLIQTPIGDIDCSLNQQYEALKSNLIYILDNR